MLEIIVQLAAVWLVLAVVFSVMRWRHNRRTLARLSAHDPPSGHRPCYYCPGHPGHRKACPICLRNRKIPA